MLLLFAAMLLMILTLTACEEDFVRDGDFMVYFINEDADGLEKLPIVLADDDFDSKLQTVIKYLGYNDSKGIYNSVLKEELKIEKYSFEDGSLDLYLEGNYEKLSKEEELFFRAALVKTFTQLEGVREVSFYLRDRALLKSDGTPYGYMSANDFYEDYSDSPVYETMNVTLYYADVDGCHLKEMEKTIQIPINEHADQILLEALMEMPTGEGIVNIIPENTALLSVQTKNQTCYINFDKTFIEATYAVEPQIVVEAIAKTMTQLNGIERIQIQVEGNSKMTFLETVDLSKTYTGK